MNRTLRLSAPLELLRTLAWAALLAFSCLTAALAASTLEGCAALASALPDVIAAIVDGQQILDAIANFMGTFFASHPDPVAQAKVGVALDKTRAALNVALRTAQGANGAQNEQVDQAFHDFEAAYLDLLALVGPYGVKPAKLPSTHLSAQPGSITVPEPIAFRRSAKKGS